MQKNRFYLRKSMYEAVRDWEIIISYKIQIHENNLFGGKGFEFS